MDITYLVVLLAAFVCGGFVYRSGVKAGAAVANGKTIKDANPIRAVYNVTTEIKQDIAEKQTSRKQEMEIKKFLNFSESDIAE